MNTAWMGRIHWGKTVLIGFLYMVVSIVIRQMEVLWTMKYYTMPQFSGVWSKLMMPTAGPPPVEFMITSAISSIATGMGITIIYYYIRNLMPENKWKRTTYFADILVSTSFVFFTIPVFMLFNVPVAILGYWFVSTFVILLVTSSLIVKIIN